jgi:hypothetical protein
MSNVTKYSMHLKLNTIDKLQLEQLGLFTKQLFEPRCLEKLPTLRSNLLPPHSRYKKVKSKCH